MVKLISQPKKAIPLVLCAWLFFTGAIAIADHLGPGFPVPTLLLFQNGISLLFILPWMMRGNKEIWKPPPIRLVLLRSTAGYLNFAFLFLAVQRAPLTNVLLLGNSAPFFIPLIIWLWRGIQLPWTLWLGIIIGFLGIACILQPGGALLNTGAFFALAAAFSFSVSMIAQRRLVKKAALETILFYYFAFSVIISLPIAIALWKPLGVTNLFFLIGLGLLSAIGQLLFLKALQFEKPSLLSVFNYSAIVYSVIIEWMFWHRVPGMLEVVGILIVLTGGLLTMRAAQESP